MYPPQPTTSCAWETLDPKMTNVAIRNGFADIHHFILILGTFNTSLRQEVVHLTRQSAYRCHCQLSLWNLWYWCYSGSMRLDVTEPADLYDWLYLGTTHQILEWTLECKSSFWNGRMWCLKLESILEICRLHESKSFAPPLTPISQASHSQRLDLNTLEHCTWWHN